MEHKYIFNSYIKYQFWKFLNKNTDFKKRNLLTFHNRGRKENYDLLILSFYVLRALSGESEKQSMLAILWFRWKEFVVEVVDCFFYFKSEFLIEKHRWICRRYVQGYVFAHASLKKEIGDYVGKYPKQGLPIQKRVIWLWWMRPVSLYPSTVRRVLFQTLCFAIVFVFWLEWAGYLALAGLNLLAQISDRISPDSV